MDAKLIQTLVRECGKEALQQLLEQELIKLAAMLNVANNLQSHQIVFIAEHLIETYPAESLADFILVFKRGAVGYYGNNYHKLDAATITDWMTRHIEEKSMYRERDNTTQKSEHSKVDYEAFKKRLEVEREKQVQADNNKREARIKQIEETDEDKIQRRIESEQALLMIERKLEAARKRGLDKLNLSDLTKFDIEGEKIWARTIEEAREMYIDIYE